MRSIGFGSVGDEVEMTFRSSVDRNCFTESLSNEDEDDNSSDISIILDEYEEDIEEKTNISIKFADLLRNHERRKQKTIYFIISYNIQHFTNNRCR